MSPRQRRGVLIIGVATIGAIGVFIALSSYLSDVRSQLGPMVTVLAAAEDIPAFSVLSPDQVSTTQVPERWAPPNTVTDLAQLGPVMTAAPVPAGSLLSQGMFTDQPATRPGEREITILVDAETGVAGRIEVGSIVDIFATFDGDGETTRPSARVVVQRARIVAIGQEVTTEEGEAQIGFGQTASVPITFALSVADARTLTYVESFARSVRLALRSPLDDEILGPGVAVFEPHPDELGRSAVPIPLPGEQRAPAPPPDVADGDDTRDGAGADPGTDGGEPDSGDAEGGEDEG